MKRTMAGLLTVVLQAAAQAPAAKPARTGPEVGAVVPAFSAADQDGRTRTLASVMGAKGAMLVFFRSADW